MRSASQRVEETFLSGFSLARERILINVSRGFVSGEVVNAIFKKTFSTTLHENLKNKLTSSSLVAFKGDFG